MQWKCGEPTQVGQLGNDKNIISRDNLLKMKSLSRSEFLTVAQLRSESIQCASSDIPALLCLMNF